MASIEGVQAAADAAPELLNSPSLMLAAASTPNPAGNAETIAASAQFSGTAAALQQFQQANGPGMYAGMTSKNNSLLTDAGSAMRVLNMPLQDVQHTYRYIRDVYHRHGWLSGIAETLGIAAGAVVGGVAGTFVGMPGVGAVLGGEIAGRAEGAIFHTDSWKATSNPHYELGGHLVSPGRDLASLLGFHANKSGNYTGLGSLLSGVTDGGFDWYTDPLMKFSGGFQKLRRSDEGLRTVLAGRWGLKDEVAITDSGNRVAQFLYKLAPGRGLDTHYPDIVFQQYRSYGDTRRAIDWIADQNPARISETDPTSVDRAKDLITSQVASVNKDLESLDPESPDWEQSSSQNQLLAIRERLNGLKPSTIVAMGRITARFPELAPMAEPLALADSPEKVMTVLRGLLDNSEMIARYSRGQLPSMTLMRAGVNRVMDKFADADLQRKDEAGLLFSLKQGTLEEPSKGIGPGALTGAGPTAYASRKVRTFTGYAPYTPDRNLLDLSYDFDPKDPNAAQGILRSLRFGMGQRTAELWTAVMTHAANTGDTALAKKIWAESQIENLKAAGLPADPALVEFVTKRARHTALGDYNQQLYGVGRDGGEDISRVTTQAGTQHQALFNWQRGDLAYPNFMATKGAMRQLSSYTKVFGWADDFAATKYTDTFFKPLALVTTGFGLRVAMNEALIGASKYGNVNYLRAMVASVVAKHRYDKLLDGFSDPTLNETDQVLQASASALGGWQKMLGADEDRIRFATRMTLENEGHIVKGVVAAGHSGYGVPTDATGRISQDLHYSTQIDRGRNAFQHKSYAAPTGSYELLPFDSSRFKDAWLNQLQRQSKDAPTSLIASDIKRGLANSTGNDEDRLTDAVQFATDRERQRIQGINPETGIEFSPNTDPYSLERGTLARYLSQTPHEFANARVDHIANLISGRDGTIHSNLLDKLSKQQEFTAKDISKVDELSLPRKTIGEVMAPFVGPGLTQAAVQGMYKRLVDPVVNFLSREPLFFNSVYKNYQALQGAVDRGIIDDQDALRFAQYRATTEVMPMIHNTALRSQFGLMSRNFMPFYFAQEQALKRAGKAIVDSPQSVARWMLVSHALSDPGYVYTDPSTGQKSVIYPGIGAFGKYVSDAASALHIPIVAGIPLAVTGDTQSLANVLPELKMPGLSPVMSLPLNWLASADPLLSPLTQAALGSKGFKEDILSATVPNATIRDTIMGAMGDSNMRSFSNAYMMALASAYYHGDLPDPATWDENPMKAQQAMDKVRNYARGLFFFKAILASILPLSPQETTDFGIQADYYKILQANNNQPAIAMDEFLNKHGDNAIGFTVSKSENAAGAYVPYTNEVQSYLQDYQGLISQHPLAMAYLAPQSGTTGNVQVINDELLRMGIKQQRTPNQFVQAIYEAQGERIWRASQQAYYAAKGPFSNPLLTQQYNDWKQQFRLWNPVAYNYVNSPDRATRALGVFQDLQSLYGSGQVPATQQGADVGALLSQFNEHWQAMAPLVAARDTAGMTQETDSYHQQLIQMAQQNPNLDSIIYNVFIQLDGVLEGNK